MSPRTQTAEKVGAEAEAFIIYYYYSLRINQNSFSYFPLPESIHFLSFYHECFYSKSYDGSCLNYTQ
jgi:hypothetical protein